MGSLTIPKFLVNKLNLILFLLFLIFFSFFSIFLKMIIKFIFVNITRQNILQLIFNQKLIQKIMIKICQMVIQK